MTIYVLLTNIIYLFLLLFLLFIRKKFKLKRSEINQYLAINKPRFKDCTMFHAVSIGEFKAVEFIIDYLLKKNYKILLTTTNRELFPLLNKYRSYNNFEAVLLPLDVKTVIQRFIERYEIKSCFISEIDLWPNLVNELNKRAIPIYFINYRLTTKEKKQFKSYLFQKFYLNIMRKITKFYIQDTESHDILKIARFKNIKKIRNLKFQILKVIKRKKKKSYDVLFASTHFEDEQLIKRFLNHVNDKNLKIALIPRNINREEDIKKYFKDEISNGNIEIIAKFGVMDHYNEISSITYVGGGFSKTSVHNVLEPLKFSNYVLCGPNIKNMETVYRDLKDRDVVKIINNDIELYKNVCNIKEKIDFSFLMDYAVEAEKIKYEIEKLIKHYQYKC